MVTNNQFGGRESTLFLKYCRFLFQFLQNHALLSSLPTSVVIKVFPLPQKLTAFTFSLSHLLPFTLLPFRFSLHYLNFLLHSEHAGSYNITYVDKCNYCGVISAKVKAEAGSGKIFLEAEAF